MGLKNWRDVERTAADYKKFFRNFPDFARIFGEKLTLKHVMTLPFGRLVQVEHYRDINQWTETRGEYLGTEMWTFEEWKGEWRRDVRTTGYAYLVPAHYQGLCHAELIRALLAEVFPWIVDFEYDAYRLEGSNDEIYVKLEASVFGRCSLYVPLKALADHDVDAIKKRNVDYFTWYYGERAHEDERYATYVDTILNDPVTQQFLMCVGNKG